MYAVGSKDTNTTPPPKPNLKTIDINLTGVIYTTVLSQHYFSRNKSPGGKIIITASSAALYPLEVGPLYAASKSAVGQTSPPYIQARTCRLTGIRSLAWSDQWPHI